jgi:hypothetical protein
VEEVKKFAIVIVTWIDAATESGWTDTDEAHDFVPPECQTMGYLVADKPDYIVLAQSYGGNEMGNRWTIPRGMVTAMRVLEVGDIYAPDKGENGNKKKTRRAAPKGR